MEYLVTGMADINSKKVRIQINYDEYIALYKGEAGRFHIEEGCLIEERIYTQIMSEILPKRARERCLNLLSRRDMTELELRKKLRDSYYPADIIDRTMECLKRNHLLNDEFYADNYISFHQKNKSIRQLKQELSNKGIDKDTVSRIIEDSSIDEEQNIAAILKKRHFDAVSATPQERTKICGYLMRKGYDYDKVRRMIME